MKLWLDYIRPPWQHGRMGWNWCKTAQEAIDLLASGWVIEADLDHDLSVEATLGTPSPLELTGYSVVVWMEVHDQWPPDGVTVHSMNPAGRARMQAAIDRHYGYEK